MSAILAAFAGIPVDAHALLDDPASEFSVAAMPLLVARAEILLRCATISAADFLALRRTEQAAVAAAARRIEVSRALMVARAMRGGMDEAALVATLDRDEGELMALDALEAASARGSAP